MKTIRIARYTALLTFLLGTAIFATYYFTGAEEALFLGYFYIIAAGVVNLVVLVRLLLSASKDAGHRGKYIFAGLLQLANIPVAVFYILITLGLLNTVRITIVNSTGQTLSNLKVSGCEEKTIDRLAEGETETLWLEVPGDCVVLLEYKLGDKVIKEDMIGYVTSNMGAKITYTIGKDRTGIPE